MDATVDHFLNEINEITPSKHKKTECVWQECYDEGSGFAYYWNTKTDEVTWEQPPEFKLYKESESTKKSKSKSPKDLYTPSKNSHSREPVKIHKVHNDHQKFSAPRQPERSKSMNAKRKPRRSSKYSDDSEDEKIVLISSYGGDTDSEEDEDEKHTKKELVAKTPAPSRNFRKPDSDNDDMDEDILSKIQKKAKELKALGGQLPPGVEKIVDKSKPEKKLTKDDPVRLKTKKDISGFSLVAGYGDSDEEQENAELKSLFPISTSKVQEMKVSHSTLFPISKPVDVKDFPDTTPTPSEPVEFDTKQFQRKRRIGIDLVNTRRPQIPEEKRQVTIETEHKGLGFTSNGEPAKYPGFKSGGVMFVKSDVLNAQNNVLSTQNASKDEADSVANKNGDMDKETKSINKNDVIDAYTTLKEKLSFLSEGRAPVSPVQEMIIQIETLYTAMKDGGLKLTYLHKWLSNTCADLIKLEKEATPEGWLLHWDRSHKRYYYQNQHTGESQWEYPQPDVVRCDEAMDICTTPPPCPAYGEVELIPPLPPKIRSPSPPPPPIISGFDEKENVIEPRLPNVSVPLPPPPPPPERSDGQPLPPGVDHSEDTYEMKTDSDPNLSSALDSFYSDIAALETSNSPNPTIPNMVEETYMPVPVPVPVQMPLPVPVQMPVPVPPVVMAESSQNEPPKKKKKTIKTEGLALKKKGVSKLVEKWKNVQMSLND